MRITSRGLICEGTPGGSRAVATFPSVCRLHSGELLATYRIGATKTAEDAATEIRRSTNGRDWSEPHEPFEASYQGVRGSLQVVYLTPLSANHIIACTLWVDREAHPGQPLFNQETEGCLPMKILVADSYDSAETFGPWREVAVTEDVGPPSLTNPILQFPSGRLAVSIETNKPYLDRGPWLQRVVYCYSADNGATWGGQRTVCQDPTGAVFHWDQRAAVAPSGTLATFSWTYDKPANRYLPIRRHVSLDEGASWSTTELDFADQPAHPAVFPNGQTVLAWVDRYGSHSIRARAASAITEAFPAETEVTVHQNETPANQTTGTGEMLVDMGLWSFGLPYAEVISANQAIVVYYAGSPAVMDIRYAIVTVES